MKYDILLAFRAYLATVIDNKNTASRYYFAVEKLLADLQFSRLDDIKLAFLESRLQGIKTKNDFSAAKNGLKHLRDFSYCHPEFTANSFEIPAEDFFKATSLKKRNWTKKGKKILYLDTIHRSVNGLKNKRLKYGFKIMEGAAARLSETAALEKRDISISGNTITVNIRNGKGGSNGEISFNDKYLAQHLPAFLSQYQENDRPFYAASTMKQKAGAAGLECHDFRRIAAIQYKAQALQDPDTNAETANDLTRQFLRHARFSTTKRYLYNRKLKIKRPEDEGENTK